MDLNSLKSFFSSDYMPHGHCYLWQEHILWTNVLSDLVIAASYFSIPIAILIFANKRKDVGYHWLFWLFSAFILLCGITHLMGIYTVWNGSYGIHGISKAVTALISLTTALYLFKLIPDAVKLPTIGQFEGVQAQLVNANKESAELKNKLAEHQVAQFMLNTHPAGTLLVDENLTVVFCNPAILKELGINAPNNLTGQPLSQFVTIDDPAVNFDSIRHELGSTQSSLQNVLCLVKKADGSSIPMQMSLVRDRLDNQEMTLITFLNLSQQRFAERQLVEYHKRMERVIDATEDGIWEWYVKENRVVYSPTLMEIIGKPNIAKPSFEDWYSHVHPDYRAVVMDAINQHFESKEKYHVEYLGLDKNNQYAWFSTIGNSLFDENGEAIVMSGSLRNIETSKLLERQVKEKTEILEAIYHGSSQAIWLLKVENQQDFIFLEFNPTAATRSGIPAEKIINKRLKDLADDVIDKALVDQLEENYQRCATLRTPIEYTECIPQNGEPKWYQTTLYPLIENNTVSKIVGAAIDITTRVQIEQQLSENQRFLERMINSAVCGLYLFNLNERKTIRINQRVTDILGYDLSALQDAEKVAGCYHQDDLEPMKAHWQHLKTSKDGELNPVKYRFKHQQGHWVWCYCVNTILTFNSDNSPEIVLGTFVDITEQTQLLIQLQESNAHLEQFAFIASHDLQEPLRKISAFSDSLNTRFTNMGIHDDKVEFELSRLIDSASRMRTMIQDLLKLSRIHSSGLTQRKTTLKALIEDVKEQLSCSIDESQAEIQCKGCDIALYLDHSLFIQALQNLITNSIKFKLENTVPQIHISVKEDANQAWHFVYSDNGLGIASEFRVQIFEPFRRLNAQSRYPGSGMGLAICKQIIKQHGGHIRCVEPTSQQGAQFEFSIPFPKRVN